MRRARFGLVVGAALWAAIGCGGTGGDENLNGGDETGVGDDSSLGGGEGGIELEGGLDGGTPCVPRTCADAKANCGPVADGCGGLTADCGTCAAGTVCGGGGTPSVCGTSVGDGGGCVKQTCDMAGANCGPIGDGCGGSIDCGTCASGLTCGGGGTPSVCGVKYVPADGGMLGDGGTCIKKTCADYPGVNCGYISDGCGDVVNCGTCSVSGEICGGIEANKCGNPYADGGVGGCKPKTCTDLGYNCGLAGDGCGNTIDCGTCTVAGEICGGGGKPSVCGNSFEADGGAPCAKKTCADYPGVNCGKMADGCGGLTADCGTCTAPNICGGGGKAGVCGNSFADDAGVVCHPKTCADYPGLCGAQSDTCGGLTANCGVCTAPDICGGGGVPSKCGGGSTDGGVVPGCTDPLCAKIPLCDAGTETSITGTVYAPNGLQPLYNAVVYIPKGTVAPFGDTVTCDRCDTPKPAIASAITGPDGKFTLKGAIPAGTNIPIVIELGKWRRYSVINTVSACVANPLPAAATRLPKKQHENHTLDNIPRMAITTGSVDALECVLRKMGIDDSAFGDPDLTAAGETKRIQFYKDNGATYSGSTPSWTTLTASTATLNKYDAVIWSCRGSEGTARTTAEMDNLRAYADGGGRVFATHYSYMWVELDPVWGASATWTRNGGDTGVAALRSDVNTGFPKGLAFSQWLGIVGALSVTSPPRVDIQVSRKDVVDTVSPTVKWISSSVATAGIKTTQHMTFNTPFKAATSALCGRVLFSDFHVANVSTSTATRFPAECDTNPLTAQEKVLEFMLFDLASCVNGDNLPPPVPPSCTPKTCADYPSGSCGKLSDGCGGVTVDCGTCAAGMTCGGGGVPGKCGGPTCKPATCTSLGYTCGAAGDGCGATLDCGTCTVPGETCGGGGVVGKCGGPKCTPQKCTDVGATCGYIGDGCGAKLYCGDCVAPDTCGGGGVASTCGSPKCKPKTCADFGATCGWVGDGCGDKVFCGDCTTAGESCGGGGVTGTCGKPSTTPCTPLTCTDLGLSCGPAGDGCGNLIDCGSCTSPETCGGGGTAGKCGAPTCVPKTCTGLGYNCGLAADGCGGVLDCGSCATGQTCGGAGTPNVCSGIPR